MSTCGTARRRPQRLLLLWAPRTRACGTNCSCRHRTCRSLQPIKSAGPMMLRRRSSAPLMLVEGDLAGNDVPSICEELLMWPAGASCVCSFTRGDNCRSSQLHRNRAQSWLATCSCLQELDVCRTNWQEAMQAELDEQRRAIKEAEAASQASLAAHQVLRLQSQLRACSTQAIGMHAAQLRSAHAKMDTQSGWF